MNTDDNFGEAVVVDFLFLFVAYYCFAFDVDVVDDCVVAFVADVVVDVAVVVVDVAAVVDDDVIVAVDDVAVAEVVVVVDYTTAA